MIHPAGPDAAPPLSSPETPSRATLGELAGLFLRLGATAFGGPAAHVAMMRDEVVRRRGWMGDEEFLDYLGATNLIPGPNSTELAIHVGRDQRGWAGLLVAGACFILPAALIVTAAAWAYVRFGTLPAAEGVLYGVKPVVIAIVLHALFALGRTALKSGWLIAVGALSLLAVAMGTDELLVLATAGAVCALRRILSSRDGSGKATLPALLIPLTGPSAVAGGSAAAGAAAGSGAVGGGAAVGLWPLFAVFAKIGSVLFGSGYVLLAFLRADLVERLHWITERQLMDAVAVGQVTPGPVFTTATFVGYLVAGPAGAVAATLGIFLPAFAFVAASARLLPLLRRSPVAAAVLDGVNVASLALMAAVTARLALAVPVDVVTVGLAAGAALLLHRRVNSGWLVLAGAVVGVVGVVVRG